MTIYEGIIFILLAAAWSVATIGRSQAILAQWESEEKERGREASPRRWPAHQQ